MAIRDDDIIFAGVQMTGNQRDPKNKIPTQWPEPKLEPHVGSGPRPRAPSPIPPKGQPVQTPPKETQLRPRPGPPRQSVVERDGQYNSPSGPPPQRDGRYDDRYDDRYGGRPSDGREDRGGRYDQGYHQDDDYQGREDQPYDQRYDRGYNERGPPRGYGVSRPKKSSSKKKIIIAIVVIIIVIVALYATYYALFIKVKFDSAKPVYHENILGALTGISVTGYLKNTGVDDILVEDVTFRCEAKFLVDKLEESLEVSIVEDGTTTISSGGKVEFDLYVGDPADTTSTTKGELVVLYKGVENDRLALDVTSYYK